MRLKRFAHLGGQAGPVKALGNMGVAVVGLLRVFVRQLQKQQVGQLFEVIAIAHTIILESVEKVPDFLDERGGVHGQESLVYGHLNQVPVKRNLSYKLIFICFVLAIEIASEVPVK